MRQWRFSGENAKIRRREKIARLRVICTDRQIVFCTCALYFICKKAVQHSVAVYCVKIQQKQPLFAKKVRHYRTFLLKIHYRTPDMSVLF